MHKIITTKQLHLFIGQAVALNFNCCGPHTPAKFDPEGRHVLYEPMLQNDGQCIRVQVMARLESCDSPLCFALDMDLYEYNNLPEYKETE